MWCLYKLQRTKLAFCSVNEHKVIRFFLFIFLLFIGFVPLSAQWSIQTRYHSSLDNTGADWPFQSVLDGSFHYWTRLKKYRLEFHPGVLFHSIQGEDQESYQNIGITVPIAFYPLDFVNDCDCPTFSKNAFWFQKGFFIRLIPTWSTNINPSGPEPLDQLFGAGISLGLDLGLSDLLTISPFLGYNQYHPLASDGGHGSYLHIGVEVLFRNDY